MPFLDTISGGATVAQPNVVPYPGDSLSIRDFDKGKCFIINASVKALETLNVLSPRLHDQQQGLKLFQSPSGDILPDEYTKEYFHSGDRPAYNLSVVALNELSHFTLSFYYDYLPNRSALYINYNTLKQRFKHFKMLTITALAGNATPPYTGGLQVLNDGQFHSDSQYALLGASSVQATDVIRIQSEETGNLKIGLPCLPDRREMVNYFPLTSCRYGIDCIPVFNGINMGAVYADLVSEDTANVIFYFAELTGKHTP